MMAVWFLCVSLLLLVGRTPAEGSSLLPAASSSHCSTISLSESPGGAFRGQRQAVTRRDLLFCDALEFYASKGCISSDGAEWGEIMRKYCSADSVHPASLAVDVPDTRVTGRKLLFRVLANASFSGELKSGGHAVSGQEKCCGGATTFGVEKVAVAIPTAFLFCCALLCPCFRSKVKEPSEQPVLELNSMDSVSSSSFPRSTAFDKAPANPLRPPPSPLRVPPSPPRFSLSPRTSTSGDVQLNFNQILKATHNFSESHIIGKGEYGDIYRADLPDGRVVSVKRTRKEHFETLKTEFSAEVQLLSKIDHRNLVKLLGYVDKGSERIIVTEYVPNGTLREHLDGLHGKILDFSQRLEIAIDVAHGLTYLHLYAEKPIIHRDVKSSNILLTESLRAKVTNFGFARIGPTEEDKSHVLTKVKGTAGYLDPEYLKTRQLTPKSDVFSFGILLLEILSGRRPVEMKRDPNERITIRWAFKKYTHGQMRDILDPLLKEAVHGEILIKMLGLAFECAAPTRADRPLMKQVGEKLWEIRKEYGNSFTR